MCMHVSVYGLMDGRMNVYVYIYMCVCMYVVMYKSIYGCSGHRVNGNSRAVIIFGKKLFSNVSNLPLTSTYPYYNARIPIPQGWLYERRTIVHIQLWPSSYGEYM